MKNFARLLLLLFVLSISGNIKAQNLKFGKVSEEELKMSVYPKDSTASAVILSDVGWFNGNDLQFTRHIRIKILKKSGLQWANWIINTPSRGMFNVHVFNLKDGEIVREKASKDNIYEEEVINDYHVYKVFAPGVKVGSVIEIRYSHFGLPRVWRFQERIPIKYNELTLESSQYINYNKSFFGFEKIQQVDNNQWKAENMPAFKTEPFLSSYKNYITKFEFQLISIGRPGFNYYAYSTSWENVNNNLLGYSNFGGILNGSAFLNSIAKEIEDANLPLEEKIQLAYESIQKNIKWNGVNALVATKEYRSNFKKNHSGNSAEINLSLIALLNKLDIRTFPVALSTRSNGFVLQYSPSIDKLNYVVAYVKHNGLELMIDATSPNLTPGILPARCLNGQGLLVEKDLGLWVDLNNDFQDITRQLVTIKVDPNNVTVANITQQFSDYSYVNWSSEREDKKDNETYINYLQNHNEGIKINSYNIKDQNKQELSATEIIKADISDQIIDLGDGYLLNPFVMFGYSNNPFKADNRKYPVDLICPKEYKSTIMVSLPESMTVKKIPESIKFTNNDGSASFTYRARSMGSRLQFNVIVEFEKAVFDELEYLHLKQFYSEIIKKLNEPIELTKKS